MSHCPIDGKPCIDDLCHGGECLQGGGEMLVKCDECGALCEDNYSCIPLCEDCELDCDDYWDDEEDDQ